MNMVVWHGQFARPPPPTLTRIDPGFLKTNSEHEKFSCSQVHCRLRHWRRRTEPFGALYKTSARTWLSFEEARWFRCSYAFVASAAPCFSVHIWAATIDNQNVCCYCVALSPESARIPFFANVCRQLLCCHLLFLRSGGHDFSASFRAIIHVCMEKLLGSGYVW